MKNNKKPIRSRKVKIEKTFGRSMEQKGFDDMVTSALGDTNKTYHSDSSKNDSSEDPSVSKEFYDKIQSENRKRKKHFRMFLIIILICIALIISVGVLMKRHIERTDGKIRVNYSSKDFKGADYKEVLTQLKKRGFTNIKMDPDRDVIVGWINKNGEVEKVKIGEDTKFSKKARYSPNVKIVITYHAYRNKK